ncbi:uncharacterized protein J3R85_002306 [Psidium guajava]|nr:uncharacterized protein J3R85_002306 [Psidium guajava]
METEILSCGGRRGTATTRECGASRNLQSKKSLPVTCYKTCRKSSGCCRGEANQAELHGLAVEETRECHCFCGVGKAGDD